MTVNQEVVTLEAKQGQKWEDTGEAIATHDGVHIVFLPKGGLPGQEVRVTLEPIREDKRGRMMYRGRPAPVTYTERWQDRGDGTASKVTVQTDWLGNEQVWDEGSEVRKLERRDGHVRTQPNFVLVWGSDLATTVLEDRQVRLVTEEAEEVRSGEVVWVKTGEREEPLPVVAYPPTRLGTHFQYWEPTRLEYPAHLKLSVQVFYMKPRVTEPGEYETFESLMFTWEELPAWFRDEVESRYPVCSCGRQRRDTQVADGYGRCEQCRAEDTCERCGKKPIKVAVVAGQLVCAACKPYGEQEELIKTYLSVEMRQAIAAEAGRLQAVQALGTEAGMAVLEAGLGHVSFAHDRRTLMNRWGGYQWYHFTAEGVFGTKFAPVALMVLQALPQAAGNGLVELVSWLSGQLKATNANDHYLRTQVGGETGVAPVVTEDLLRQIVAKLEAGEPILAEWLRQPEAARVEALAAYRRAVEAKLHEEPWEPVGRLFDKATKALQGTEQDYASALAVLEEAFAAAKRLKVLDELVAREYTTCPVCGEDLDLSEGRRSHCCSSEQEALRAKGGHQDFPVKVSHVGEAVLVELVAECDEGGYYDLRLRVNREAVVNDPNAIETKVLWRQPNARERKLTEKLARQRQALEAIERELSHGNRVVCQLADDTNRLSEEQRAGGIRQLQSRGRFTGGVEFQHAPGEDKWRQYDDVEAIFSCRVYPDSPDQPQPGETWILLVKFQITIAQGGIPVLAANPRFRDDRQLIRTEIARLEAQLEAERGKVASFVDEAFDEDGVPQTAMAAAFAEALGQRNGAV